MIDLLMVVLQASALVLAIAGIWALMVVLGFGLVQHLREQRGAGGWTHASKGNGSVKLSDKGLAVTPGAVRIAAPDSPLYVGSQPLRVHPETARLQVEFARDYDEKVRMLRQRLSTVAPLSTEWQQIRAELAAMGEDVSYDPITGKAS